MTDLTKTHGSGGNRKGHTCKTRVHEVMRSEGQETRNELGSLNADAQTPGDNYQEIVG